MRIVREGGLLRLTLDAPQLKNQLTTEDCRALSDAIAGDDAGAVLLEAEGQMFCGGLSQGADPGRLLEPWTGIPVVAAVQAPAINEGLALLACAHIVVAAQGTSFALTGCREGVFPQLSYGVLARAIGERRALELALTGRIFTAPEALAYGLVHQIAPPFEFLDRAEAIANALAARKFRIPGSNRSPAGI